MRKIISVLLIIVLYSLVIGNWSLVIADEYRLGPYDTVELEVMNHPELKAKQTVTPDGLASFPLVGVVSVEGKSLKGLQDFLVENYSIFIEKPKLTIGLTPRPIYIVQYDLKKDTWEVKMAKSVDEAKALTGFDPTLTVEHGNIYKVTMGNKPEWMEQNWYKVITATAVLVGIYTSLNR
ncbi:polysaccharide biosynthesis/export family protein [Candidatus Saganbacteria bacterium]|nr:polysaccharide biosynthesis/export family protein [Candidatus Saganbacteria bacterium]